MADKKREDNQYNTNWGVNRGKNDSTKPYDGEVERKDNNIYFYSYVSQSSIQRLVLLLDEAEKDILWNSTQKESTQNGVIKLYINTGGGVIVDGLEAYNKIKSMQVNVNTIANGFCASAGSLLYLAGKERIMGKYAFFLIHQLSGGFWGTFEMMKDEFKNSEKLLNAMINIYKDNMKLPKAQIEKLLKRDIFLNAEECLKMGIATKIV